MSICVFFLSVIDVHIYDNIYIYICIYIYMYIYGAVRSCMSETYEQRQLVEPRDWEGPAIGPRKCNEMVVNSDAAWCLDCGAAPGFAQKFLMES